MHPAKYVLKSDGSVREFATIHDNVFWRGAQPRISICVPTLRHDVTPLLVGLSKCEANDRIEVIVYDDGSRDHDFLAHMEASAGQGEGHHFSHGSRVVYGKNRSHGGNSVVR